MTMEDEEAITAMVRGIDQLMIAPERSEELMRIRDELPTWLVDQVDATLDQARRALHEGVALGIYRQPRQTQPEDNPESVRHAAIRAIVLWVGGKGQTCQHSPHPNRPQPLHAAAWRPRLVVCPLCVFMLSTPQRSVADRTCLVCLRVVGGAGTSDVMRLGGVQVGALTFAFGVCQQCCYWSSDITCPTCRKDYDPTNPQAVQFHNEEIRCGSSCCDGKPGCKNCGRGFCSCMAH